VVAIASRSRDEAIALGAQWNIPRTYASYSDIVADPDVEALYIPLPNHLHAPWSIEAAKRGKHVLCEKPAATTPAECAAILAACESAGVHFFEGFMYRFHPQHARVRQLLADGVIGQPSLVRARFSFPLEARHSPTKLDSAAGGGALLDLGSYCVDLCRWVFDDEPATVFAHAAPRSGAAVERAVAAILDFGTGRAAVFDVSFDLVRHHAYDVLGPVGRIEVPSAFVPDGETTIIVDTLAGRLTERFGYVDQFRAQFEQVSDWIRGAAAPPSKPRDALANARVLAAVAASMREGRAVNMGAIRP
jgi:D-xylose 1-dehydrogenase (NADP+, D-xylono-1,5-lactone-forming)